MDIQREEFEKAYVKTDYYQINYEKTNACNSVFSWNSEANCYTWHDVNSSWLMWQQAQKVAVPEGFVLVKGDPKTVVAIERMVEQQVEASGMDFRRLERLDGWRIIDAMIEAQEQVG